MTTKNDITGDSLRSKTNNKNYRDNWDKAFGKQTNTVGTVKDSTERQGKGMASEQPDKSERVGDYNGLHRIANSGVDE